ncbi:hypothetical protein PRNP1_008344 [Phytophthora ramorum]
MTYRELLATRVLSVDAYWEELRDPRRRLPNERDIPVPLWPGESVQQYEREFCRWLASQRLSLASMRENPVAERNCRLQFAQTRVARVREGGETQRPPSQRVPRSRRRSGRIQSEEKTTGRTPPALKDVFLLIADVPLQPDNNTTEVTPGSDPIQRGTLLRLKLQEYLTTDSMRCILIQDVDRIPEHLRRIMAQVNILVMPSVGTNHRQDHLGTAERRHLHTVIGRRRKYGDRRHRILTAFASNY